MATAPPSILWSPSMTVRRRSLIPQATIHFKKADRRVRADFKVSGPLMNAMPSWPRATMCCTASTIRLL